MGAIDNLSVTAPIRRVAHLSALLAALDLDLRVSGNRAPRGFAVEWTAVLSPHGSGGGMWIGEGPRLDAAVLAALNDYFLANGEVGKQIGWWSEPRTAVTTVEDPT